MFTEAEQTLRKGLETLTEWSDQARDVLENRPGVILASLSIAGFMTGVLLRQGRLNLRRRGARKLAADPMTMFLTGAIAGFTLGPRVVNELMKTEAQPRPSKESDPELRTSPPS